MQPYRDDLAYIHDAGYGATARAAAQELLARLGPAGSARELVVDLGCGSGILAEQVAAAGFDVLGIDLSEEMLALARRRVPQGTFRQGSVRNADLPPCRAVTAIGEVLNYLFDEDMKDGLPELFARIFASLSPGGLFLFDLAESGRYPGAGPHQFYREEADWTVLVTAEEDREQAILTRRITSFRRVGELYRRDQEVHRQRLFPRSQLTDWLGQAGFQVHVLHRYANREFPRGLVGFLARK